MVSAIVPKAAGNCLVIDTLGRGDSPRSPTGQGGPGQRAGAPLWKGRGSPPPSDGVAASLQQGVCWRRSMVGLEGTGRPAGKVGA